jgi:putative membrane-bound dehydrogenase-like protein
MKRLLMAAALLSGAVCWLSGAVANPARTHQVRLNGHTFTLPTGFEIEMAAGPPLVDRPIVADFDEEGRLYVADSSGSNEKVEVQLQKKPHRIVRLEDGDGDGRFDRRTIFADRMMFPEGCMWLAGSLYVAAPPSIWKLTDSDGDGVADQRVEWFKGKTLTGCANDLHGPYLGPDGWVYWAKGAFARQTYERPGRAPLVTRAAHLFRCRPDGSGVEPVMTGGMDNPVDVVFTPGGERIFTTTFLQFPGGGRRDGLIHAIYGGVYGKDHDVVHEHPWTAPALMPVLTHFGAAAPTGLARYTSRAFGPEYQDNLFAALFNMHKVTRHVLEPVGATFKSRDEDFLVADSLDFHPTDVLEDADGSLLVIDTGGWYKLCCPTSQLVKPDVLGAIYRVRRSDAPRVADPRGLRLAWKKMMTAELAALLGDPRPAVRQRAIQALGGRGATGATTAASVLREAKSVEARRNAVWSATRIDNPGARQASRIALADADETVRQAALHSVSVWRDSAALPALVALLKGPSPHNRRAAAEALGRIGDRAAVGALLEATASPADRALEHSLTYALIEIADREGTSAGLKSTNPHVRRAALTALDQMEQGKVEVSAVLAELASPDRELKETAWWIAGRHPEWDRALAEVIAKRLDNRDTPAGEREDGERQLARFARAPAVEELLAQRLRDATTSSKTCGVILHAMARAGGKEAPVSWLTALTQRLTERRGDLTGEVIATIRAVRLPRTPPANLSAALLDVAGDSRVLDGVRLQALAAVPGGPSALDAPIFALLRSHLSADQPVRERAAAAEVLGRARLHTDQLLALAEVLPSVGPMEINRLLDAFARSSEERVGLKLLASLKAAPARSGLRPQTLRNAVAKSSPAVRQQAEELLATLHVDTAGQQARLEHLLGSVKDGDVRRGQAVFNSTRAACSSCHAIGYLGGTLGPDLTQIGRIRSERDLLESIVFPSASFVRGYEPVVIVTRDGRVHNGVIRKDGGDEVVLGTGANQELRLARGDIEDIQPSRVSVMPAGLDQQLTARELADLVAFLKACR